MATTTATSRGKRPTVFLYMAVAKRIKQMGPRTRAQLKADFPDFTEDQIQRALENAAARELIFHTGGGIYSEEDVNPAEKAENVVQRALDNRSLIERAWDSIVRGSSSASSGSPAMPAF